MLVQSDHIIFHYRQGYADFTEILGSGGFSNVFLQDTTAKNLRDSAHFDLDEGLREEYFQKRAISFCLLPLNSPMCPSLALLVYAAD